jgi:hypothetical protein
MPNTPEQLWLPFDPPCEREEPEEYCDQCDQPFRYCTCTVRTGTQEDP